MIIAVYTIDVRANIYKAMLLYDLNLKLESLLRGDLDA